MDFHKETEGKINATKKKETVKRTGRILFTLACGSVMASCATGYTNTSTVTYRLNGGGIYSTTTRYSELDAARANRENARAVREYGRTFRDISRGVHDLRRAFR